MLPLTDESLDWTLTGWGKAIAHLRRESLNGWGGASNIEEILTNYVLLLFLLSLILWFVLQKKMKYAVSQSIFSLCESIPHPVCLRARQHSRQFSASSDEGVTMARTAASRSSKLFDLSEEEYFHGVNATRKKPLRCAPYCDQIHYTKYDPDCFWKKHPDCAPRATSTPNYKKQAKAKSNVCDHAVGFISEDDFDELCSLVAQIGFMYVSHRKKRKTMGPRSLFRRQSAQSHFSIVTVHTFLMLTTLLPGCLHFTHGFGYFAAM